MPPTTIGDRSDPGRAHLDNRPSDAATLPAKAERDRAGLRMPLFGWRTAFAASLATLRRHGRAISADLARVRRLPSLALRAGTSGRWSEADRREADDIARSLVRVGAWCAILVMPGGFLLLPVVFADDRPRS
jgi:hypothetical protein